MRELREIRDQIDEIDDQICSLYLKRLGLAADVAEYKLSKNLPVFDEIREKEKLLKLSQNGTDDFSKNGINELFTQIMSVNRKKQYAIMKEHIGSAIFDFERITEYDFSDKKICYQGVKGAYSEKAALSFFGENANLYSVDTWRDALDSLFTREYDYAVVPVENSSAGMVNEIFDLLAEFPVCVIAQQTIKINHALLGLFDASISDIRTVYSHPQALMQCSSFLNGIRDLDKVSMPNTAMSAMRVHSEGNKSCAAIGDEENAELYGLKILKKNIQNDSTNETRFLILSRDNVYSKDADLISICFELSHSTGSLYHALSNFTYNGLNMTHIVSRPIFGRPWEYKFFVDIEGNLTDESVQNALFCLKQETGKLKILGNYVRS